jgi:hypothetical protein
MQTFMLRIDRDRLANTLLERAIILGYNNNKNCRVIVNLKPERPVSDGEDQRFNPDEQQWKIDDLLLELKSAVRLGDCSNWPEQPLSPFEEAIRPFVDFDREIERGPCVKRSEGCYLKSWGNIALYENGNFEPFKYAVEQLSGFADALNR